MSIDLTQQQSQILKQLKLFDADPQYTLLTDFTVNSCKSIQQNPANLTTDIFFDVDYDPQHAEIREKLMRYRNKSEQIYQVGELIKDYESKFTSLMKDKDELIGLIQTMKGTTSELVEKQKRMIDLSIKTKFSLDYYMYHQKFNFDYPCEISYRQMYQNILQPTISELTDGLQYFQENTTYTQSKKYLIMFQTSQTKMLSFVKSFFIKLFNKEESFVSKNSKASLNGLIDTFYPKSKIKLISSFLLHFPQFQQILQNIIKSIKQSSGNDQIKFLEIKEMEIYEFQLNKNNLSLLGYLQRNMPQIYESILNLFTFYRTTFHQNLLRNPFKKQGNFPQIYSQRLIHMMYLISCQYSYILYCCRATKSQNVDSIRNTITTIAKYYMEQLIKMLKDVRNRHPVQLCEVITKIKEEFPIFLDKNMREEYQSYAFGAVGSFINEPEHLNFLKILFDTFTKRLLTEMETMCFNSLVKISDVTNKNDVEDQVKKLLESIPKLKYCENQAERYLIASLDTLVKSIKQVNTKIQSRFECYIWNLEIFGNIKFALKKVRGNLIRKELKLDVNNSANIIERFKRVERNQSYLKYAQDIFNVIKTGMPVINELTLDFNKFILEHCQALQSQFVKDILFIYAKNMIQFLHKLSEAAELGEEKVRQVCLLSYVQNLYSTFTLSIQKYIKDAEQLLKDWNSYKVGNQSKQIILSLLDEVYERLFDLMDKFYVNTSKYVNYTENFKEIDTLKGDLKKSW